MITITVTLTPTQTQHGVWTWTASSTTPGRWTRTLAVGEILWTGDLAALNAGSDLVQALALHLRRYATGPHGHLIRLATDDVAVLEFDFDDLA